MPGMMSNLSRFEDQIQRVVEGGFARLFAGRLHPREVAVALARAMEDHVYPNESGNLAPDVYTVRLNPVDHDTILHSESDLADQLAAEVVELARAGGLALSRVPEVRLLADADIPPRQVAVSAKHSGSKHDTTQAMPLGEMRQQLATAAPKASLILEDFREIPLDQPIFNIGRQHDNTIILDDSAVSRHHAQIRLRFGRYVLFDLGSTAGTTVNGKPVQERALESGDVIRLADLALIYVEEEPGDDAADPLSDTQTHEPLQP